MRFDIGKMLVDSSLGLVVFVSGFVLREICLSMGWSYEAFIGSFFILSLVSVLSVSSNLIIELYDSGWCYRD